MPRIKLIKTESSITTFGRYLSIQEWIKLKKRCVEYINKLLKMKREQIIHALYTQKVIGNIDLMELLEKAGYKDYSISSIIDRITDAILALPLDVPSDEEIEETLWEEINIPLSEKDRENNTVAYKQYKETFLWMRWMRNEIIKRNRVI